ncbi:hypothetical protein TrispH2_005336 [Trichoplax sp. H2]|nr:hypothetical protein TrispH2_005336 [Trichoplax sp. H2]|eukprot:RDD43078.1 hypothetical protein TrispH2_005336 [Trichoplax sp. H2]
MITSVLSTSNRQYRDLLICTEKKSSRIKKCIVETNVVVIDQFHEIRCRITVINFMMPIINTQYEVAVPNIDRLRLKTATWMKISSDSVDIQDK